MRENRIALKCFDSSKSANKLSIFFWLSQNQVLITDQPTYSEMDSILMYKKEPHKTISSSSKLTTTTTLAKSRDTGSEIFSAIAIELFTYYMRVHAADNKAS